MIKYNNQKWERLRYKFPESEKISENFSQAYQDMFVLSVTNGKRNGSFLEIGAFDATFISNTFLLERDFGWNGVSIDIEESARNSFENSGRKSKFILGDALEIDYSKILEENFSETRIDYLMIDIEPTINTFECLKKIPLDKYRFNVITYETDFYDPNTPLEIRERVRKESREILKSYGYVLLVGDVANLNEKEIFEDWYIDSHIISDFITENFPITEEHGNTAESYMIK
jgi:hypothetical protein